MQYPADSVVQSTVDIESLSNLADSAKSDQMEFTLCTPYSAGQKGGRTREEKRIKGGIECAIDKKEKKKKMLETQQKKRKHEPIEPDDQVEYRNIKKKQKKKEKTVGKVMDKTVGKAAKGKGRKKKSASQKQQRATTTPKRRRLRGPSNYGGILFCVALQ
jgi:hypothetical protein